MNRKFIKGHAISIMPSNNVYTVLDTDQYGRTVRQRTVFTLKEAEHVHNLFCQDLM